MDLKTLLGDNYKDDMSIDDINSAISNMKLADLSTGMYVNKEAAEAERRKLEAEKQDLQGKLSAKLTDDEKAAQAVADKDKQIEQLMAKLKENTLSANRSKIYSSTAEMRGKLGIGDDDKDFQDFANLVTLEDTAKVDTVSKYLSSILKSAYEKGANDKHKQLIGENADVKTKGTGDGNKAPDKEDIGAKIGKAIKSTGSNADMYFNLK